MKLLWRFQYTQSVKLNNKKRFNFVFYTVRYFLEMTIDSTRYLVEDLKHAIKLGQE